MIRDLIKLNQTQILFLNYAKTLIVNYSNNIIGHICSSLQRKLCIDLGYYTKSEMNYPNKMNKTIIKNNMNSSQINSKFLTKSQI